MEVLSALSCRTSAFTLPRALVLPPRLASSSLLPSLIPSLSRRRLPLLFEIRPRVGIGVEDEGAELLEEVLAQLSLVLLPRRTAANMMISVMMEYQADPLVYRSCTARVPLVCRSSTARLPAGCCLGLQSSRAARLLYAAPLEPFLGSSTSLLCSAS